MEELHFASKNTKPDKLTIEEIKLSGEKATLFEKENEVAVNFMKYFYFKIEKEADNKLGFLLMNPLGDFLWFGTAGPASRYQGWFVSPAAKPYKIIEN